LSKPAELPPIMVALLAVLFVTAVLSLIGGEPYPITAIISIVAVGTGGVFIILYVLVRFSQLVFIRRHVSRRSRKDINNS
jgi:hypothetical protein